ncbi:MAG: hypothetical protein L0206_21590, partial [Actinobacteria bacterium]|nr:hypothetical protein [Actinomycetota bacterium]
PDRPAPLDQWLDVIDLSKTEGDAGFRTSYALRTIDRIVVTGTGADDRLLVDSRIRVRDGIAFDGGGGTNGLIILGAPGESILKLDRNAAAGRVLIGGGTATTDPTLSIRFDRVQGVEADVPDTGAANALAKLRAGLCFVATSKDINTAFDITKLPVVGASLTKVFSGATGATLVPHGDKEDLLASVMQEDGTEQPGRFSSVLGRLLTGDGVFSLDAIGMAEIPDLETLRQVFDDLDATAGNVILSDDGTTIAFDVTVDRPITGVADLDLEVLGGSLFLKGLITASVDVALHVRFGVDDQGVFIDSNPDGAPELMLRNLTLAGDIVAGGHLGLLDVALSNPSITTDPAV